MAAMAFDPSPVAYRLDSGRTTSSAPALAAASTSRPAAVVFSRLSTPAANCPTATLMAASFPHRAGCLQASPVAPQPLPFSILPALLWAQASCRTKEAWAHAVGPLE